MLADNTDSEDDMNVAMTPAARRGYPGPEVHHARPVLLDINSRRVACSVCGLRDLCLSDGLDAEGKVAKRWDKVSVDGHAEEVLAALAV